MNNLKFSKVLSVGILSVILLAACGEEESSETKESTKSTKSTAGEHIVEEKEQDTEETVSIVQDTEKSKEESKSTNVPLKTTITVEEFNSKFKLDDEEVQYPNGKFELKDGSIINADSYSYGESDLFDYALGTFYEGKAAHLQIETQKTAEEFANALGVTLDNTKVVPNKFGFEIIFDPKFSDENISVFPSEW
ncbi:hypothetical protein ACFWGC_27640 [Cytobacillus pseudoceanisediminis]|uniref:hypothetical protein n=1 Tax=Cytobacillus pseudoceanisediminis TaxID=3051614 RepID=UPI003651FC14